MSTSPRKNLRRGMGAGGTDIVANTEIRETAWRSRGWTLQEAILSPRKVFFGNVMFHMSCGGLHESEDGIPFSDWFETTYKFPARQLNVPWSSPWWHLVMEFSSRRVTFRCDTLLALSSLARTYSDCYPGQRYLAGLWESDLEKGLLWTHETIEPAHTYLQKRKVEYIAPSWSWACGPCKTSFLYLGSSRDLTKEFELRAAKTITMEKNPFGRVYGGHLLLEAKTHRPLPDSDGKLNISRIPQSNLDYRTYYLYYILQSKEGEYITYLRFDWDMDGSKHKDGYPEGPIDGLRMVLISSYRLCYTDMQLHPHLKEPELMLGLLVRRADDGCGYERVGLFVSENRGLGGRKFWNGIETEEIMLV